MQLGRCALFNRALGARIPYLQFHLSLADHHLSTPCRCSTSTTDSSPTPHNSSPSSMTTSNKRVPPLSEFAMHPSIKKKRAANKAKEAAQGQDAGEGAPPTHAAPAGQQPPSTSGAPAGDAARVSSASAGPSHGGTPAQPAAMHGPASSSGQLLDLLHEPSWRAALEDEFRQPYFNALQQFVASEMKKASIFPPRDQIFRAFNSCPFDQVKVVVLGQDPYHREGLACGLCFSVARGVKIPSSLQNIFKELKADVGCPVPSHGELDAWSHQGVLLLNAVLTVRSGQANSHAKKGWEQVTDAAIRTLAARRSGIVFLLWGRFAEAKAELIDASKHHVLVAAHPSGLSAHRGFFGCKHFSKANELLVAAQQQPIDWCIP